VEDYSSICFASEILESVLTNGDGRKKGEKLKSSEVLELVEKLFTQTCTGLIPDHAAKHLSYIQPNSRQLREEPSVLNVLSKAMDEVLPVQLDAGNGYVPYAHNFILTATENKYSYSTGWDTLPAYDPIPELFPIKQGFKPWFAIFSDTWGDFLFFYYPENPKGIIEVPYSGVDLGDFTIYWRHGTPGLCEILQIVYFEWVVRGYSYGIIKT
jgi:hypothetical protein